MTADSGPLAGRRILVTRAAHQIGKLSDKLREVGMIPVEVPVLEIQPPESFDDLDAALRGISSYDWLILTSANTVRSLADRANQLGLTLGQPESLNVAAIGEGTAKVATEVGLKVTIVPVLYVAESLVSELVGQISGCLLYTSRCV